MFSIKYISYKNAHDRTIFIFCYVIIFWKIGCANLDDAPISPLLPYCSNFKFTFLYSIFFVKDNSITLCLYYKVCRKSSQTCQKSRKLKIFLAKLIYSIQNGPLEIMFRLAVVNLIMCLQCLHNASFSWQNVTFWTNRNRMEPNQVNMENGW